MKENNRRIELFDQSNIDHIEWPQNEGSQQIRKLPLTLLKRGVDKLILNVQTDLYFLKIDDVIIPLTVNDKEYNNSYVTSNYYFVKSLQEKGSKLMQPLAVLLGLYFKSIRVNRSIIVNNWLLSNSLHPELTSEQVGLMTQFLVKRFPDHLIMVRGLNTLDGGRLFHQLQEHNYHTIHSREIFAYDPHNRGKRSAYHRRRDEKVMHEGNYEVGESQNYQRLIWLYDRVYKDKHTHFCPHYTEEFLREAVSSGFIKLCVLKQGGNEVGLFGYIVRGNVMIVPIFGYDTAAEKRVELYRILTMLVMKKAEELDLILNDGSGGDQSKTFRGMTRYPEYAAVYVRHLSAGRKLFWNAAKLFSRP